MKSFILCLSSLIYCLNFAYTQNFYDDKTPDYNTIISYYDSLAKQNNIAKLLEVGGSDIGKPIHLFVIDKDKEFEPTELSKRKKTYVLINNGIHPGEACGIEASMKLAEKLLINDDSKSKLKNVVLLIIPTYNISGTLNRNSNSRTNQLGPEEHGFRGNIQNLDLNRDFIKADSKNAMSFNILFNKWQPDIFIETHTTNGSDHSYTLTLIGSQKDKLNPEISSYQYQKMLPALYSSMEQKSKEIIPYIYPIYKDPKDGIKSFLETPRYSTGYTSLFDCFSFISEAHAYKTYSSRVEHTYSFLESLVSFSSEKSKSILKTRKRAREFSVKKSIFPLNYKLDSSYYEQIKFNGYSRVLNKSSILKEPIYTYDSTLVYDTLIPLYNQYIPEVSISKPKYYVIPQAYQKVIDRLKWNKIEMTSIAVDTLINGSVYYIEDYKTVNSPYEGHYLHYNIEVKKKVVEMQFYKGDYLIPTEQANIRYLIETIEPQSIDGYFAWNFFDGILQQKEWFSDFSFLPKAEEILRENDDLRKKFEDKLKSDSTFYNSNFQRLYFIYKNSKYYENSAFRYPVLRIEN